MMEFEKRLPIPKEVKEKYPISKTALENKRKVDDEIKKVFSGESKKLILIVGPCSADNKRAVLDYVVRLKKVYEKVTDKLIIIPRIYTSKPRTTGDGYKGMLFQPNPNEAPDTFKGILLTRALHAKVLSETGMPTADELLYPADYRYVDDLLSYVTVGARSVENQEHRLVASGVSAPVGMKNPTSGDLNVMLNAVDCARNPHTFIYRGWQVHTKGNPFAHMILRGFVDRDNNSVPNYDYKDLTNLYVMAKCKLQKNISLVVDANHSNSNKNPFEQPRICKEVLNSCKKFSDIKTMLKGFMIESYLEDGCQKVGGNVYGKSITDACLGFEKTERLIYDLAEML